MNRKVLLLVVIVMMVVGNVWAADPNWNGSTSIAWSNASNWSAGVPTSISKATVNNVGAFDPTISSGTADVNQLFVAESAGNIPGAQTVTVSGGKLKANQEIVLGYGDTDNGTLLVSGTGDVNSNHLLIGFNPGSTGNLHIDGGIVNVRQMFGLSWNGGTGNATLDGGVLHTEQFAFKKAATGTAYMNITAGQWQQEHFWQNEIKGLVYYGKIKAYAGAGTVFVDWNPTAGPSGTGQTIVTAVNNPPITVKKLGGGDYTSIQAALFAASGLPANSTIEVQDSENYIGNLTGAFAFPASVPGLIVQAKAGFHPTITVVGTGSPDVNYISMKAIGQTLQGFKINFSGTVPPSTINNSSIINSVGGASTVRDCRITGPATGWITGITAVANIEDVDVNTCRIGVVCDLNSVRSGFRYSVKNSKFHDNRHREINFTNCSATMDKCEIYNSGNTTELDASGGLLIDGNEPDVIGRTDVLITNSIFRDSKAGRLIDVATTGVATIEDSIIRDAKGNDLMIQRGGTLNFNRCLFHVGDVGNNGRAALNQAGNSEYTGGDTNIDHCTFEGDETRPIPAQWVIVLAEAPDANVIIRNSIVTAAQGLFEAVGTIDSNFNDVFCSETDYESQGPVAGAKDISVDPFYIQTNDDSNTNTYYVPQPYSPVAHADENGNSMGWKEPVTGYEKWPADLDGVYGVDFRDFAIFARGDLAKPAMGWREDRRIPADSNTTLETFESYAGTGTPGEAGTLLGPRAGDTRNAWRVVANSFYTLPHTPLIEDNSSALTLLEDVNDANSGYGGTKAMTWVYDVNDHDGTDIDDPCQRSTEILVVLPQPVDMNTAPGKSRFNNLRVMLKRHSGNSPDNETYMYVKLLDMTRYGTQNPPIPTKQDIIKTIVGGSTAGHPDQWYPWSIPLAAGSFTSGMETPELHMTRIDAIIFGIESQPLGPYGRGEGTIDVDLIELVDLPACLSHPVGDLYPAGVGNGDCIVDFMDLREFVKYWLMGQP